MCAVLLGREGKPRDAAGLALFLSSPAGQFVNGALIPLDGGSLIQGSARL